MALLSESNSWKLLPIFRIEISDGASLAFNPTVWASPTFSSVGTMEFVMTVSANQPSRMGTHITRMKCAIFDRSVWVLSRCSPDCTSFDEAFISPAPLIRPQSAQDSRTRHSGSSA